MTYPPYPPKALLAAVILGACGLGAAACGVDTALGPTELCDNGLDDDGDQQVDCADSDCAGHLACQDRVEYLCENGLDDDGDQQVDCDDPDCGAQQVCNPDREVECDDGLDNDGDALTDCADPDCTPKDVCQEKCSDGLDNDRDGLTDCRDPDCEAHADCQVPAELDCADGVDNDHDGLTDCADDDCVEADACQGGPRLEICDDGVDNDHDGHIDCDDPDCAGNGQCEEWICDDGWDNDHDGLVDCEDGDCQGGPLCQPDPTCQTAIPIGCGDSLWDWNIGAPNTWTTYPCLGTPTQYQGGERIYELTTTQSYTGSMMVEIEGMDGNVEMLLVSFGGAPGQCDPTVGCQASASSAGEEATLSLYPAAGTTLFLVVDSVQAQGSDFTLSVYCENGTQELCDNGHDDDLDGAVDCWDMDCLNAPACNYWVSGGTACDPANPGECAPGEHCRHKVIAGLVRNDGVCTLTCQTSIDCDNSDYPWGACLSTGMNQHECVQRCGSNLTGWQPGDCPPGTECRDPSLGTINPADGVCFPIH